MLSAFIVSHTLFLITCNIIAPEKFRIKYFQQYLPQYFRILYGGAVPNNILVRISYKGVMRIHKLSEMVTAPLDNLTSPRATVLNSFGRVEVLEEIRLAKIVPVKGKVIIVFCAFKGHSLQQLITRSEQRVGQDSCYHVYSRKINMINCLLQD